ncbi:hypothetical protein ACFSW8_03965 [Rubritalea tangerina]|uniref:Benzylsuccinate synthase n=1 Tax=Rubritalea tangerina TaxID=430798 RepID=A0ABW4Z804_9BACT
MSDTATKTKTCAACAYWDSSNGSEGNCRRSSPQTVVFEVSSEKKLTTVFPVTASSDWCGEYKEK